MEMFKVGDVVRLKGGSPALTVVNHREDAVFLTWWDDATGDFKTKNVAPGILELCPDPAE